MFKGFILLFIATVVAGNEIHRQDFPNDGEYCVISKDLFWRTETLMNPNQYYYCANRTVFIATCPQNMGFLRPGDKGCTYFTTWKCLQPKNLDLSCGSNGALIALANPNNYGYCVDDNLFSHHECPTTFGFIERFDFLGCTTWITWNKYTRCF